MTVRTDKSNAPLRNRTKKALKRLDQLAEKYEAEGMSKADARKRAQEEMRENQRGDWRAG